MDCVAVIPARYHSTRFPGKALADLAGRPLIAHVIARCRAVPGIEEVVVATDDERIAQVATDAHARAVMTPADLESGTDRVAMAAAEVDAEVILNVQGDEPLIESLALADALAAFRESDHDYATLRAPLLEARDLWDPNVVKVVVDHGGRALYFSRAPVPFPRACHAPGPDGDDVASIRFGATPDLPGPYWLHVGVYLYRCSGLARWARIPPSRLERAEALEQLRVLEAGYAMHTYPVAEAMPGVDTPADLERVRRRLERSNAAP